MARTKHTWQTNEEVSIENVNNLESSIPDVEADALKQFEEVNPRIAESARMLVSTKGDIMTGDLSISTPLSGIAFDNGGSIISNPQGLFINGALGSAKYGNGPYSSKWGIASVYGSLYYSGAGETSIKFTDSVGRWPSGGAPQIVDGSLILPSFTSGTYTLYVTLLLDIGYALDTTMYVYIVDDYNYSERLAMTNTNFTAQVNPEDYSNNTNNTCAFMTLTMTAGRTRKLRIYQQPVESNARGYLYAYLTAVYQG